MLHSAVTDKNNVWFVCRHPGAIEWAKGKADKLGITVWSEHLDFERVKSGDTVIGVLPVSIAAQLCEKGVRFIALSINVSRSQRGTELSAKEMQEVGISLHEYRVVRGEEIAV